MIAAEFQDGFVFVGMHGFGGRLAEYKPCLRQNN